MIQAKYMIYFGMIFIVAGLQAEPVVLSQGSIHEPVRLSAAFFSGHVRLAHRFTSMLLSSRLSAPIVEKMNRYLGQCDARQKEMFIDIVNQKLERLDSLSDLNVDDSISYFSNVVDDAIALTDDTKHNNWLSGVPGVEKKGFFSALKKQKIEDLFKSALTGDKDAVEKIQKLAKAQGSVSVLQQRVLLSNLEAETFRFINYVLFVAQEKTKIIQDNYDDNPEMLQSVAAQQEANTRAIIKYSKDILQALRPLCSNDQYLMSIVDRTTLAPLFNVINMKDFSLKKIASDEQLEKYIASRVAELEQKHLLRVPAHKETKPVFLKQVQDIVENHYVHVLSNRIYTSLKYGDKQAMVDHIEVHGLPVRLQEKIFENLAHRQQVDQMHRVSDFAR